MTLDDAKHLLAQHVMSTSGDALSFVRSGSSWRARPVGIVTEPSLLLEAEDGHRFVLPLNGTEPRI